MKPKNLEIINRSFALQAPHFESKAVNFTKEEYLNYTLSCVGPRREETLFEVAAGTCAVAAPLRLGCGQLSAWTPPYRCCRLGNSRPSRNSSTT